MGARTPPWGPPAPGSSQDQAAALRTTEQPAAVAKPRPLHTAGRPCLQQNTSLASGGQRPAEELPEGRGRGAKRQQHGAQASSHGSCKLWASRLARDTWRALQAAPSSPRCPRRLSRGPCGQHRGAQGRACRCYGLRCAPAPACRARQGRGGQSPRGVALLAGLWPGALVPQSRRSGSA